MLKSKIKSNYIKHRKSRICQGDLLRDFSFWTINNSINGKDLVTEVQYDFVVILSQDCDLESNNQKINEYHKALRKNISSPLQFNQFLPNILFLPAFQIETIKTGNHLVNIFNITQRDGNSSLWINNSKLNRIKNLDEPRFHYLDANTDYQIPELLLDFKIYYTIPLSNLIKSYKPCYIATVSELFRESLSQRYTNYLNRIGLPEFKSNSAEL